METDKIYFTCDFLEKKFHSRSIVSTLKSDTMKKDAQKIT